MNIQYDDVNPDIIEYIDRRAVSERMAFFYVSRRHWIEVAPEFLTSMWLVATVISLSLVVDLGDWFAVWIVLIAVFSINPFLVEMWRWQRDIYFLTQDGYKRSYYSFKTMSYVVEELSFVSSAKVQQLMYYKVLGINIGTLVAKSPDGRVLSTPLMPNPLTLQHRLSESKGYKPAPLTGGPVWRT